MANFLNGGMNQYSGPEKAYGQQQKDDALQRAAPGVPPVTRPRTRDATTAHQNEQRTTVMSGGPAGGASGGLGQPAPGYIPGVDAFPNQVTENVVTNAFVWSALANTPGASNNVKALAKEAITKAEPYLQTLQQAQQPQVNPNG